MSRPRQRTEPLHVVLLAGGSGTRFWPLSRAARPKQLLALAGDRRSLLRATWERVRELAPPSRIWVVAPTALAESVREQLPRLRPDNLVLEPSPRDTAPAIALACAAVRRRAPRAVVAVLPTDHVVRDQAAFVAAVRRAAVEAGRGALVCLGVRPDRPATGFGYLRCARPPRRGAAVDVARFVEKPDAARARRFVRSGRYLWNAGMFVWRAERFLEELGRTAPATARAVDSFLDGTPRAWGRTQRISVDYAVMEQASGVRVVPLDAGWDDVGSWDAAARLAQERDASVADGVLVDSDDSVVFGDRRFVALIGVPGIVVVDTPDALLIVARERAEQVKQVVETLRRGRRTRLL